MGSRTMTGFLYKESKTKGEGATICRLLLFENTKEKDPIATGTFMCMTQQVSEVQEERMEIKISQYSLFTPLCSSFYVENSMLQDAIRRRKDIKHTSLARRKVEKITKDKEKNKKLDIALLKSFFFFPKTY